MFLDAPGLGPAMFQQMADRGAVIEVSNYLLSMQVSINSTLLGIFCSYVRSGFFNTIQEYSPIFHIS